MYIVEARAAMKAGCKAILVKRPGNKPLTESEQKEFKIVTSFKDIQFDIFE